MPEVEKCDAPPPQEFEFSKLQAMRLTAINATIGKLQAEIQVAELQIEKLQRSIKDRTGKISRLVGEHNCAVAEIVVEHGVDDISKYDIDLESGRGRRRPQLAGDRERAPRSPAQETAAHSPESGSNP